MMNLTSTCVMYVALNKIISLMPLVSNLEDCRHRHFSPLYSNNIGTRARYDDMKMKVTAAMHRKNRYKYEAKRDTRIITLP